MQGPPLLDNLVHGKAIFVQFFAFTYETIFFVDVVWATPGYILSAKLFDTHVRSAEPTFLGEYRADNESCSKQLKQCYMAGPVRSPCAQQQQQCPVEPRTGSTCFPATAYGRFGNPSAVCRCCSLMLRHLSQAAGVALCVLSGFAAGWAVALSCYPPFVQSMLDAYCTYHSPQNAWGLYFKQSPRWLFWSWGISILVLSTIYCWATVMFGVRFSNLTNRVSSTAGRRLLLHYWLPAQLWRGHEHLFNHTMDDGN